MPSVVEVMKTAVPGTRGGFFRATSSRKRFIGSEPAFRMLLSIVRPVFHVLMMTNTRNAIAMVTQPPLAILSALAENSARSPRRKIARKPRTVARGHFHLPRATTAYNTDVIANAP